MTSVEVIELMKEARQLGVLKLKIADFECEFDGQPQMQFAKEADQETLNQRMLENESALKELELDTLRLSDPVEYERLVTFDKESA